MDGCNEGKGEYVKKKAEILRLFNINPEWILQLFL
jgi:hypothetical protein